MTKIKLCGLTRPCDIDIANTLNPDYIGFVFAKKSRRFVSESLAKELRSRLKPGIMAVGVFVREDPENIVRLLDEGIIDIAQLHGGEDPEYLKHLQTLTQKPIIQAFRIDTSDDLRKADASKADIILLDSGAGGTGTSFDWTLLRSFQRPYLLAGGLNPENAANAVRTLNPWGVDVSSGIETDGLKDANKMINFVRAVRGAEGGTEDNG